MFNVGWDHKATRVPNQHARLRSLTGVSVRYRTVFFTLVASHAAMARRKEARQIVGFKPKQVIAEFRATRTAVLRHLQDGSEPVMSIRSRM